MKKEIVAPIVFFALTLSLITVEMPPPSRAEPTELIVPDDYPTIEAAIGNASEGCVIFVKEGKYCDQTLSINTSLSLIGQGSVTTVLTGPSPQPFSTAKTTLIDINAPFVNISGFTMVDADICIEVHSNKAHIFNSYLAGRDHSIVLIGNETTLERNTITQGGGEALGSSAIQVLGSFNTIKENNINCSLLGIELCGNSTVISKNSFACEESIFVHSDWPPIGGWHNITENKIVGNSYGWGIRLIGSQNNTVFKNTISNCDEGITLGSASHNIIQGNLIANCNRAIFIDEYLRDVSLRTPTTDNIICRNAFVDNILGLDILGEEFSVANGPTKNFWDNGNEGNYWSDYLTKYPNASEVGSTGVWDSPYVLDANNVDHYPLISSETVPEFSAWILAPLCVGVALIACLIRKRKEGTLV